MTSKLSKHDREVEKAYRAGVQAERDRCAKIAERFSSRANSDGFFVVAQVAMDVATSIRLGESH